MNNAYVADFKIYETRLFASLFVGNTSTNDLGGGVWDFWYGPSGRSGGLPSVNLLVPKIASSTAAKAMAYSGVRLNLTRMGEMQHAAEFTCDQTTSKQISCNPYETPCLFNVEEDPCELYNVADRYPNIVDRLLHLVDEYNKTAISPMPRVAHPEAFPKNHGNVWTTWEDADKISRDNAGSTGKIGNNDKDKLPPTLTTTSLDGHNSHPRGQPGVRNQASGLGVNIWVGTFSMVFIALRVSLA